MTSFPSAAHVVRAVLGAAIVAAVMARADGPLPGAERRSPEALSVTDFGARGDGKADDGPAIQAAIDAAAGRCISLPPGTFRILRPLEYRTRGEAPGLCLRGAGMEKTTLDVAVTGGPALRIDGASQNKGAPPGRWGFQRGGGISDLAVKRVDAAATGNSGVEIVGWWFYEISRVRVDGLDGDGIVFPRRDDIDQNPDIYASAYGTIAGCQLVRNRGWGIDGEAGLAWSGTRVHSNVVAENGGGGIRVGGHNTRITNNAFAANGRAANEGGVRLDRIRGAADSAVIEQNEFDSNWAYHVLVVAGFGHRISSNRFVSTTTVWGAGGGDRQRPDVQVMFGDPANVHSIVGCDATNNYHRSTAGPAPVTAFRAARGSFAGSRLANNVFPLPDNSSHLTKYDGISATVEVVEEGRFVRALPGAPAFVGRIPESQQIARSLGPVRFEEERWEGAARTESVNGFLAPYPGLYQVDVALTLSGLASGDVVTLAVRANDETVREAFLPASGAADQTFQLSTVVSVRAGTRIGIAAAQSGGAPKALKPGTRHHMLSIVGLR